MWVRKVDIPIPKEPELPPNVEDGKVSTTISEGEDILEEDIVPVSIANSSSSGTTLMWKQENCDAPNSEFSLEYLYHYHCYSATMLASVTISSLL